MNMRKERVAVRSKAAIPEKQGAPRGYGSGRKGKGGRVGKLCVLCVKQGDMLRTELLSAELLPNERGQTKDGRTTGDRRRRRRGRRATPLRARFVTHSPTLPFHFTPSLQHTTHLGPSPPTPTPYKALPSTTFLAKRAKRRGQRRRR